MKDYRNALVSVEKIYADFVKEQTDKMAKEKLAFEKRLAAEKEDEVAAKIANLRYGGGPT